MVCLQKEKQNTLKRKTYGKVFHRIVNKIDKIVLFVVKPFAKIVKGFNFFKLNTLPREKFVKIVVNLTKKPVDKLRG